MTIVLLVLSVVINIVFARLLYIASKRLLQYQDLVDSFYEESEKLVDYCRDISKRDLLVNAPEVVRFHKLVVDVAHSFPVRTKEEKEAVDG